MLQEKYHRNFIFQEENMKMSADFEIKIENQNLY